MVCRFRNIALLAASAAGAVLAHLEPGSLSSPKAGMSYAAGSQVNITWGQAEYHFGKYTLWYSRDGGTSWESIVSWQGPGGDNVTVTYAWTVPASPGAATRVRVCQIGDCDDPDYALTSGSFAITPAATAFPSAGSAGSSEAALRMGVDRNLEVSFGLASAGRVALKAFAADGSLAAVLLEGEHAAGSHAYSLASGRLLSGEPLILRLEAGGKTLATLRSAP